ncbi:cell division protein FtsA [Clostridium cellulovorans]|uniref:Cell division protein FtsA n=1 Tax=Clostridium cellulovorans (strain ATCC 35296 / DSM 3052 / OCM 3 / 743B) TaxID=573061 RepID=D9SL73_CLOC7|nr:cell division protein FtsA [Clostridium cellulovorans]ADL51589.1 cell division protein FtsA [Clostridium cellulovorans 743B]
MSDYIVGLDIGSSKVCMAVGRTQVNGEIQIIGLTSVQCEGIKKAVVVDIDKTSQAILECKKQIEKIVDIDIKEVFLSLPSSICQLVWNKGIVVISSDDKEVKESDIERVLESAKMITVPNNMKIIGVEPLQYIIDGYENIKEPIGMSGNRLELDSFVILAEDTVINNLFKSITKAGIIIKSNVFQPTALSKTVLKKGELEIGAVIVDVGSETTDISIFKDGKLLFNESLTVGGNTITSDISLCLKLMINEAEKLKIMHGDLSMQEVNNKIKISGAYNNEVEIEQSLLNEIIYARVEEILLMIKESIINSGYYDELSGIVIVGGGLGAFKGSLELTRKILNKPCRIENGKFIGVSNPIYVGAISVVNDVYEYYSQQFKEIACDDDKIDETINEEIEDSDKMTGIISKFKRFIEEFF